MGGTMFTPGDLVAVSHFLGCEAGARGIVTEMVQRLHPADGSLISLCWVRFDEPQALCDGTRFGLAAVPPSRLRRLDNGE